VVVTGGFVPGGVVTGGFVPGGVVSFGVSRRFAYAQPPTSDEVTYDTNEKRTNKMMVVDPNPPIYVIIN
jgi:hypothetical protein